MASLQHKNQNPNPPTKETKSEVREMRKKYVTVHIFLSYSAKHAEWLPYVDVDSRLIETIRGQFVDAGKIVTPVREIKLLILQPKKRKARNK